MPSRLITVPNKITIEREPDGSRREVHTPDFFGFEVKEFTVKSDYRDVSKVLVTLPDKPLAELVQRSREHFTRLWGPPTPPSPY